MDATTTPSTAATASHTDVKEIAKLKEENDRSKRVIQLQGDEIKKVKNENSQLQQFLSDTEAKNRELALNARNIVTALKALQLKYKAELALKDEIQKAMRLQEEKNFQLSIEIDYYKNGLIKQEEAILNLKREIDNYMTSSISQENAIKTMKRQLDHYDECLNEQDIIIMSLKSEIDNSVLLVKTKDANILELKNENDHYENVLQSKENVIEQLNTTCAEFLEENSSLNEKVTQEKGEHENQVSDSQDLSKYLDNCVKNPGHTHFIPIKKLTLKHLPEGHRDEELCGFIRAASDLTVCVNVTMTSLQRPEFWPDTEVPYFLYTMRASPHLRTGSGWIKEVFEHRDTTCPCDQCRQSGQPNKIWWDIHVETATNLIFDETEASKSSIRLFYDREYSPLSVLSNSIRVYNADFETDWCTLSCTTCDRGVSSKLKKMRETYVSDRNRIRNRYTETRDVDKLMFIVSHPHGGSKQVCVGRWTKKYKRGDLNMFTYTTSTCPGSSGAPVFCLGFGRMLHCGTLVSGLGYSSF
ncbi:uncharacterized protein LOC106052025 isoform X3 [Biomphalaria glabrata]|uniref:Uncharacterized protein LOC106052025 isoform X3 n=1 Tax=Biomphalaria glabrata TaxID=6526 RepID=A0A9W3BDK9_BIOGL|nr:uncharacterized protein LOC106052025 isoform X3 [Biomphalaria glabrata]